MSLSTPWRSQGAPTAALEQQIEQKSAEGCRMLPGSDVPFGGQFGQSPRALLQFLGVQLSQPQDLAQTIWGEFVCQDKCVTLAPCCPHRPTLELNHDHGRVVVSIHPRYLDRVYV